MFYSKSFKPFIPVVFCVFSLVLISTVPAHAQGGGNSIANRLAELGGDPVTVDVNCIVSPPPEGAFDSVVDAINSVSSTSAAPITIIIDGMCEESVNIVRDDVTLMGKTGNASDGIFTVGDITAVRVESSANGTFIKDLTLSSTGGGVVMICALGTSGLVEDTIIHGNYNVGDVVPPRSTGVVVAVGASCAILDSVIRNVTIGVLADGSSSILLRGSTIQDTNLAISALLGSSITLSDSAVSPGDPSVIKDNGGAGFVLGNATFRINNAKIIDNGTGLNLSKGSTSYSPGFATLEMSGQDGFDVFLSSNSTATGGGNLTTTNPSGLTILCIDGTAVGSGLFAC